jgi:hypothetical protein
MRVLAVADTAIDLTIQERSFTPGNTVLCYNPDSGTVVVETSATAGGSYTSVGTIPATGFASIKLTNDFVKVSSAKTVYLLNE